MNALDVIICILLVVISLLGAARGLVRLLFTLASLLLAGAIAIALYGPVAEMLFAGFQGGLAADTASFALLFVSVLLAMALLSRLVVGLLRVAHLRWMDRVAGGVVGAIRFGVFLPRRGGVGQGGHGIRRKPRAGGDRS